MSIEKEKKDWVFIINPTAGNGFAGNYIETIKDKTRKYNIEADFVLTEKKGHASVLAKIYAEKGYKYLIAVGGDGTFNEMAGSLLEYKDIVTGIVPAGTGNDFAQILGFSDRFTENEWEAFFSKNSIFMDAGICNNKPFFNGMGLGFDAQVAAENYIKNGEGRKKGGNKNKYLWHIIKTILFYNEQKMIVTKKDGAYETECFINTIANGRRFAGGFQLTPKAVANDGMLDLCVIRKLSVPERFKLLPKVPKGKHLEYKKVQYFQTNEIQLKFFKKVPFHLDGELFFDSEFHVTFLPCAIKIIYHPNGNHFFNK